ncbi:hypothetical protein ykris0001_42740 [Yersinia kristensenii ATCC 33638]|nr:hypothetical protein ykris0001_42740 [Yersinia kristensenii ATCC 33638]
MTLREICRTGSMIVRQILLNRSHYVGLLFTSDYADCYKYRSAALMKLINA